MKYLLFLFALFCTINYTFAQEVKFGVKAGINLSEMSSTEDGSVNSAFVTQKRETSTTTNFNFGGFVDIRFKNFSIQPGLTYITKGGTSTLGYKDNGSSYQVTEKLDIHYIELPVNLLVNLPLGPGDIFFGGGPYIDFGLSGKNVSNFTSLGRTTVTTNDIKFGSSPSIFYADGPLIASEVKNPALGINTLAGFKLNKGLQISAGYGFTLTQISNNKDQTAKINSAIFAIGYSFK